MVMKDGSPIPNRQRVPPAIAPVRISYLIKWHIIQRFIYLQVNNIMHSLFSNCTVKLNEAFVNPNTDFYPYKAYIASKLSYSALAKETWMQSAGW